MKIKDLGPWPWVFLGGAVLAVMFIPSLNSIWNSFWNSAGDGVSNATAWWYGPTGPGTALTPTAQAQTAIAVKNGWMDGNGNLTPAGQTAIQNGSWATAMNGNSQ